MKRLVLMAGAALAALCILSSIGFFAAAIWSGGATGERLGETGTLLVFVGFFTGLGTAAAKDILT